MQEKRASEPLSIDQFLSAFLLLVLGITILFILLQDFHMHFLWSGTISSICLLLLEHIYVRYVRQVITNNPDTSKPSYCAMDKSGVFFFKRKVKLYYAAYSLVYILSSKSILFRMSTGQVTIWWGAAPSPSPWRVSGNRRRPPAASLPVLTSSSPGSWARPPLTPGTCPTPPSSPATAGQTSATSNTAGWRSSSRRL